MPAGAAGVVDALRRAFDDRARREADVKASQVVGRNTDGSAKLLGLDGECISRGGAGGYDGEIVVTLPQLLNREGTAGSGVLQGASIAQLLWIDSIDPAIFPRGATLEVAVVGKGFTVLTRFEFLLPASEDVHPGITVDYVNFTDSEHVTLGISVAADAELVTEAPIAYDDPSMRF